MKKKKKNSQTIKAEFLKIYSGLHDIVFSESHTVPSPCFSAVMAQCQYYSKNKWFTKSFEIEHVDFYIFCSQCF